ncbi:MAG: M10 family metallopeptidase C-terminal domain-containing protein, partial [Methylococcales bacterium]|nr:M10 family metallopeptidase C-terminal domain-containing protein [Methylococcales bacterium]
MHIRESYTDFSVGTKGFNILLHEIGHALGLKHSFKSLNENPAVLFGSQDTNQYTVMSYNAYEGVGKSYTNIEGTNKYSVSFLNLTTPMLYDVQAIQYLYGKNITLSNNDIYRFSTDTTEFKTIWDAGGNDTFDLSDHSVDAAINLTAGRFSSIGDARYFDNGIKLKPAINNIAIAYGVEIENAIGGKGNDFIIGNDLENKLTGGSGNDLLDGGKGNDTAIYKGNLTDYKIEKRNSGLKITSNSANNEGIDSLRNIEKLQFSDQTVDAITLSA